MSRPPRPDEDRPAPDGGRAEAHTDPPPAGGVVRGYTYRLSRPVEERLAEGERLRREPNGPGYNDLQTDKSFWIVWQGGQVVDRSGWHAPEDDPN